MHHWPAGAQIGGGGCHFWQLWGEGATFIRDFILGPKYVVLLGRI